MNVRLAGTLALATLCMPFSLPVWASSLPRVDFGTRPLIGLGFGSNQTLQAGGSLSIDVPVNESFMLGGAAASTFGGGLNYDVRGVYRFIVGAQGSGPSIAAIVGLWGQPGLASFQTTFGAAPFVGFGMAYPITDRFTARLDLAYAPFFDYASANETFVFLGGPPTSGVEVGYRLMSNLEATLGINGRGDFLGASYTF
jgi:hypothetical protein